MNKISYSFRFFGLMCSVMPLLKFKKLKLNNLVSVLVDNQSVVKTPNFCKESKVKKCKKYHL